MTVDTALITKIASVAPTCDDFAIVQPVEIGRETHRNELLLFVKPEIFMVKDIAQVEAALDLVFTKLAEFGAVVSGVAVVGGKVLEEAEIMNRHYGYINRLSRFASQMVDAADRQKIAEALELPTLDGITLYGGHEYLKAHPGEDCFDLDTLWFTKKSHKIRSGFYVQHYTKDGESFILVNGFHPAQLLHFTDPTHRIVLVLVHSDTPWAALRNEMVGATFPEKAVPHSIRGTLYTHAEDYGLGTVSIANNGVHLSAGPFEGLFEINNFFGEILNLDIEKQQPLLLKKMLAAGLPMQTALKSLENPIVTESPKPTDLFTATEDVESDAAVALWKQAAA
jgi:nucleoside diphosphate kinase